MSHFLLLFVVFFFLDILFFVPIFLSRNIYECSLSFPFFYPVFLENPDIETFLVNTIGMTEKQLTKLTGYIKKIRGDAADIVVSI